MKNNLLSVIYSNTFLLSAQLIGHHDPSELMKVSFLVSSDADFELSFAMFHTSPQMPQTGEISGWVGTRPSLCVRLVTERNVELFAKEKELTAKIAAARNHLIGANV